ncbi:hypothetical protein D9611_002167 [Ephemerocybe angulata]|uniref:Cystathionine gamma-synthase n=1 Tax=Ephemerocybe angulata TaxID=980116 RepID=A0A8H5C136_9AGAR|nr:hypothetical protein D9611_002167 [Tulosesus angulatus]
MSPTPKLSGTDLIHGDTSVVGASRREVAPSISVTTTFRAPKPEDQAIHADLLDLSNPTRHVYSRYTQDVSTRVEHILGKINHGYALTYSSGLSAAYAALVYFQPKRLAIRGGYHGCHATIDVYKKTRGENITLVDLDDEFQPGDLCWLETPVNPTGESRDIRYYADKVHKAGGKIIIDSTFGPPPLQYPFKFGADCVLHSGTKYFGGHSDLLAGVLVVKDKKDWDTLHTDRTYLGSMMGSLESWLLLRSLKTLHLRVPPAEVNTMALLGALSPKSGTPPFSRWTSVVSHPKTQMEGGYNATFSFKMKTPEYAAQLPHLLNYFVPATSLGGVESLIERRLDSDPGEDPALIRVSIGVEDLEDLKSDLRQGLRKLVKLPAKL